MINVRTTLHVRVHLERTIDINLLSGDEAPRTVVKFLM